MPSTNKESLNRLQGTIFSATANKIDTKACLPSRKPIPLQYLSLASWTAFMYWSLFSLLLNFWGLLWVAAVSALMFVVGKYSDGLQELEVLFDKKGVARTITTRAFLKKTEEKKKKNI